MTAPDVVSESFIAGLIQLRSQAGNPSLRKMAELGNVSHATPSTVVHRDKLASWTAVRAWVVACGGRVPDWEELWKREKDRIEALASPDSKTRFFGHELAPGPA